MMPLTDVERMQRKKARRIYTQGLRTGKVVRADFCQRCRSSDSIHGHHDDYDKPLEIISLCPSCHALRHRLSEALRLAMTQQAWLHRLAYSVAIGIHGKSKGDAERFARRHAANRKSEAIEAWGNFIIKAVKDA